MEEKSSIKIIKELDSTYLAKEGTAINSEKLNGAFNSKTINPNTIAQRDSASDIHARLFRSNYSNQDIISGAIAFRNDVEDNYIRFCNNPNAIRDWLGAFSKTGGEISGNIIIGAGEGRPGIGGLNGSVILRDHNNGNTTISGGKANNEAGDLYVGYNAPNDGHYTKEIKMCRAISWINDDIAQIKGKTLISSLPNHNTQKPEITLALGDSDTGFNSPGDGVTEYWSNNVRKYSMNDVWHTGNFTPGAYLPNNGHGGTLTLSNWIRTTGNCGWYSESYGGGIFMTDSAWVRTFNDKNFYCNREVRGRSVTSEQDMRIGWNLAFDKGGMHRWLIRPEDGSLRICRSLNWGVDDWMTDRDITFTNDLAGGHPGIRGGEYAAWIKWLNSGGHDVQFRNRWDNGYIRILASTFGVSTYSSLEAQYSMQTFNTFKHSDLLKGNDIVNYTTQVSNIDTKTEKSLYNNLCVDSENCTIEEHEGFLVDLMTPLARERFVSTSNNDDVIDLNKVINSLWMICQEQQQIIEQHEIEINKIKEGNVN